jgi:hypothetical protein
VLLAEAELADRVEAATWLRREAYRLAVRLDPPPRSRWAGPGLVRPAPVHSDDAPCGLRVWAEDAGWQAGVWGLLSNRLAFALRFPDAGGAWYELAAEPFHPFGSHPAQKTGSINAVPVLETVPEPVPGPGPRPVPARCDAGTDVPEIMGIFAKRASLGLPGGDVLRRTRCALAPHAGVEHVGIVRPLTEGAVWVTFTREVPPYQARRLPPCPSAPCGLYPGHPGACLPAEPGPAGH